MKKRLSGAVKALIASGVIGIACLGLWLAGTKSESFVEHIALPFSRWLMHIVSKITGILPFSLAEIGLYLLILAALVLLVLFVKRLFKKGGRKRFLANVGSGILVVGLSVLFLFYSSWGLTYYAPPLAQRMGYSVYSRHYSELKRLNTYLMTRADALADEVGRDENGNIPTPDFRQTAALVAAEFSKLTGRSETPVKAVLASVPMSYTQITGIFTFITGEGNINTNTTPASLPFTMAHETAHRYGIAREDEANFFAFYVLYNSDEPLLKYSAYMMALVYCQNQLYASDVDSWREVRLLQGDNLTNDYEQYSEHWKQYEGKVAEVSEKVNNTYLQVQGQWDGTKSYGRMVDLMLAWYEAENPD